MRIIIDTNFLLIPAQFNVDIFAEIDRICIFKYKLYVLDKTITELKKIISNKKQSGKNKAAAKLALQLLKAKNVSVIKTTKDLLVDDILIEIADENTIIATQDMELKRKLKKKSIKLIVLRAKNKLILV